MSSNKPKFNIFIILFISLWTAGFAFAFWAVIDDFLHGYMTEKQLIIICSILFVGFLIYRLLFFATLTEDIDFIRYLFAKIKFLFIRHVLKNKDYTFKFKKIGSLYELYQINKTYKEQEKTIPSRNFLRFYHKMGWYHVFANKFCVVVIDYKKKQISYFDKISLTGFCNNKDEFPIDIKILKKVYDIFCKSFTYNTDINKAIELIKMYLYIGYKNINEIFIPDDTSVNNMSIAELASLPGINLGKANKIHTYRKTKQIFTDINHFLEFSEINKEDGEQLKELLSDNLCYKLEKKSE